MGDGFDGADVEDHDENAEHADADHDDDAAHDDYAERGAYAEHDGYEEHQDHRYEPPVEEIASGLEAWRRRTASGAILSAVAMGLAQVFNLEHKKPAIIAEAPGDPYDEDDPVQVEYVPDDAEGTRVRVRPWLFGDDGGVEA